MSIKGNNPRDISPSFPLLPKLCLLAVTFLFSVNELSHLWRSPTTSEKAKVTATLHLISIVSGYINPHPYDSCPSNVPRQTFLLRHSTYVCRQSKTHIFLVLPGPDSMHHM